MLTVGKPVPDLLLPDLEGVNRSILGPRGRVVVINFWSADCPWSERADLALGEKMKVWGEDVTWVSIASNSNELLSQIRPAAAERGLPLILIDRQHQAADLFQALTTPHCFVVDARGWLRYQGAFDDVTFRRRVPARFYVIEAVESLLAGKEPALSFSEPYGCTIVRGFLPVLQAE